MAILTGFGALLVAAPVCAPAPVTTHPRLWLRADDLARLRSWAVAGNPLYQEGLVPLAAAAKADMDARQVPERDTGGPTYVDFPTEMYAELFAFMSLVAPDTAARDDYGRRARTCLMHVINAALPGAAAGQPFRDPDFAVSDRSRWHGEAFALTVDWAYPYFSAADKAAIRTVFLRWADENIHAETTLFNHPEPIGVTNDPALLADRLAVRWSANNYYTAHMRNIGMMALALDAADDPAGELAAHLRGATGAWLYVVDALLRGDARGGLAPEGFEYSPQSVGYVLQFLLALRTAGQDDTAAWGPQVSLSGNPFWNDVVPAYLHSLSPATATSRQAGVVYQPAWYGSAQDYWAADPIQMFGPLGIYDQGGGSASRLAAVRWIQTHVPPGGAATLLRDRVARTDNFRDAILYFMLLDPAARAPADPRPAESLTRLVPGIGRLFARTGWGTDAAWFVYTLGWNTIDHQKADGNHFELYRRGEWLTKQRTGYDLDYAASDNHNTLALENDRPQREEGDYRIMLWRRGSQWVYQPAGDPRIVAHSFGRDFVYALGDATVLYNSTYEELADVTHASRSIVWLSPDHVVVYDRAASRTANRFKRFWLNLPAAATVSGTRATMTTPGGQRLAVTTLLPAGAVLTAETAPDEPSGPPANDEPMRFRLRVEAPGGPATVRFLNVLQGLDAGAAADTVTALQSTAGTPYAGAVVRATAVLFPVDIATPFASVTYAAPVSATRHLITGLTPNAAYDVTTSVSGTDRQVTVRPGTGQSADSGGVLVWTGAAPTATTLYFPRLVSSEETAGAAAEHTGVALANLDTVAAQLTFTAFDRSGAAASGSGITNPRSIELGAGAQMPLVDTEIFGTGLAARGTRGWLRVESTARKVTGFFLTFDDTLSILDGADAPIAALSAFVLPEIDELGFTELHVVNPGGETATATVELVASDGSVRAGTSRTLEPRGALDAPLTALFPATPARAGDYIRVSATRPVIGYEYLGRAGRYVEGLNGQDASGGGAVLYSAQYAAGSLYRTTLSVVNLDTAPATVTLRLTGDDGAAIGTPQTRTIPARGKLHVADPTFFGSTGPGLVQGYVAIQGGTGARLAGSVVFGDPDRTAFSTALPLAAATGTSLLFGQVASNETYFTGLAVLNPGDADVAVRIEVCAAAGTVLATRTDTLGARRRMSGLLTELFPVLRSQSRASGYIRVTADRPVAGFALFGTASLSVLSAIPPQSVP